MKHDDARALLEVAAETDTTAVFQRLGAMTRQ